MSTWVGLLATAVLLGLNAFFVAAEFALVSARRAAIEPAADGGSLRARTTLEAMERVSQMLAGAQLGITLCSLALGALSEPAVAHLLEGPLGAVGLPPGAGHPIAFTIALLLITVAHVVLGEMVPKNVALAAPERSALTLTPVLAGVVRGARPLIWLLNGLANATLRLMRVEPKDEVASAFTRDEVASMVEQSHREGLLAGPDRDLIGGALAFERARVADIALPLARVHTLSRDATPSQVEQEAGRTGVTRFPLRDGAILLGYVHLKDTLSLPPAQRDEPVPTGVRRALPSVADDASLVAAIEVMRAAHAHLAAVVPAGREHPVGVVTLDDVLASLVRPPARNR